MQSKEAIFWEWFSNNEAELYDADHDSVDIFHALNDQLLLVSDGLTFEFSAVPEGEIKEFCISADGMKEFFPALIELVRVAPKFDHWRIKAFRQRMLNDEIVISMGDIELSYDDIFFRYANDDGLIALEIHLPHFEEGDNDMISATFVMLDALLGEYDVATQISSIDWVQLEEEEKENLCEFVELRAVIDTAKAMKN